MKSDILRLILFLAGAALILGIYLADRFRRRDNTRSEQKLVVESDIYQREPVRPAQRREPLWGEEENRSIAEAIATSKTDAPTLESEQESESEQPPEPIVVERESSRKGPTGEQKSFPFFSDKRQFKPKNRKKSIEAPPSKIIQINIVPRTGVSLFGGDEILCVVSDIKMEYGEMDIYHRYSDDHGAGEILFSLANMVHPGTFPVAAMDEFTTPGLTLFTNLPGPLDGLTLFSEMLSVAERLATLLDGSLQDDRHSDLSKQTIEHMRQEIQEYHRKLTLARSR